MGWFAVVALAVACRGRSSVERLAGEPADAGASAGGTAGTETGGTGALDPSTGGAIAAGRGGRAGTAGGGQGGTAGVPADGCTCDEPYDFFTCTRPLERFCYGPSAFECPPTLENALANLDAVCQNDGEVGRYSECSGGYAEVRWVEGGENEYRLFFDRSTGELVGGVATGYLAGSPSCDGLGTVQAGTVPSSCVASCRFCREFAENTGGEGGEGGLPLCPEAE